MREILPLTGELQIPVPFGYLSLLVFDALPGAAKVSWSAENRVLPGQKDNSDRGFSRRPIDTRSKPS